MAIICDRCDHPIDPTKYDDCDKYFLVGGEKLCQYCFEDWARDWLEGNMEELAHLVGVPVVEVYR